MTLGDPGPAAHGARDPEATRRRGFAIVTAVLAVFLIAAAAPSPLYAVYAATWHFSATELTAVFAVYALALLATLLVAGTVSDAVGRRPVILTALLVQAAALVVFLTAQGLPALYLARIVQGAATGLATSAVAAALIDLQPPGKPGRGALVNAVTPTFGLAAGALVSGALVQYAPAPTRLVYAILLAGTLALAAAMPLVSEPSRPRNRPRLTLRPVPGLRLEPGLRSAFLAVLPALVATWALGGLYLSLGPSIAYSLQGSTNRVLGGLVVAILAGTGGVASLSIQRWSARRALLAGCAALTVGGSLTVLGVATATPASFYLGTAIAGAGFGAAFLGAFRTLAALATPSRRGELATAIYLAAYLAFSVPAVAAGILTTHVGLRATAIGYGGTVVALALAALAGTRA